MNTALARPIRHAISAAYTIAAVLVSYCTAWLLRFDFSIPAPELSTLRQGLLIFLAIKGMVFFTDQFCLGHWSRACTFVDLLALLRANLVASAACCVTVYLIVGREFPRSVCFIDLLVCVVFTGALGFSARAILELRAEMRSDSRDKGLLIYGAGIAGIALAREIRFNPKLGYRVLGFLDDDARKHGGKLLGLPVLGSGDDARAIVAGLGSRRPAVDEIVVAMPSATGIQIRAAVEKGRAAGVKCRIVPGLGELITGKLPVRNAREISVTDLLGREPVHLDAAPVQRLIEGRVVLVTGAAGSIGSELCNQIAQARPRTLVALDQAESEMFRLESDLRSRYPGLSLAAEIGDIRDARRVEEIVDQHATDLIYHAAAYKHVPVMERHVCEAVRNNVIGTWNVVQSAWRCNVSRCLLISTDKAVNPSSTMGLTKRVAELLVSAARPPVGRGVDTKFICVRFGNVLVSNGSVVPIFEKQIAAGGPVTVTHPEMRRYFMTVEEAVQLVLQASAMGNGSEIYVLDMGKPVRIVDLARKMIAMAGLRAGEDIEIKFVGLRPGEKMFEEINLETEHRLPTTHPKISIFQGRQLEYQTLPPWIAELQHLLWRRDPDGVIAHLRTLVPEYQPLPRYAPGVEQRPARVRVTAAAEGHA